MMNSTEKLGPEKNERGPLELEVPVPVPGIQNKA